MRTIKKRDKRDNSPKPSEGRINHSQKIQKTSPTGLLINDNFVNQLSEPRSFPQKKSANKPKPNTILEEADELFKQQQRSDYRDLRHEGLSTIQDVETNLEADSSVKSEEEQIENQDASFCTKEDSEQAV